MPNPKIDEYMPFFYRRFFQAVEGYPDDWAFKYLRVVCHYWDKRCVGLTNDDMLLRNICRCEQHDWERLRPIIFGQFFKYESGLWHQDFARSTYKRAIENYEKNLRKTAAATAASASARRKHST